MIDNEGSVQNFYDWSEPKLAPLSSTYKDYIDLSKVNGMIDGLHQLTGFVFAITNSEGAVVAKTSMRKICSNFHRCNTACASRCRESSRLLALSVKKQRTYQEITCLNGLVEIAIPIIIEDNHVGDLFTGQFFYEQPDLLYFREQAKEFGFDEEAYLEAVEEVPVLTPEKVSQTIQFLILSTHLFGELVFQKKALIEAARRQEEQDALLRENEEKYHALFNTFPVGIAITDAKGLIRECNERAREILNADDVKSLNARQFTSLYISIRPDGSLLPPDEWPMMRDFSDRKDVKNIEMGLLIPGHDPVWLLMKSSPLQTGNDEIVTSFIDVTHYRQAENDYHNLFNKMFNGFAHHEIILDGKGNPIDYMYIAVNPAFEEMTGLKSSEIIGKRVREILPNIEDYWIQIYGKVATTGVPTIFENYSADFDKWFEVTTYQPSINKFSCIFTDITERKQAENVISKRLEYEHLIAQISEKATTCKNIDIFKNEALAVMGESLGVSRVYIFQNKENDILDNTHEWCNEGIPSVIDTMKNIPAEYSMDWWNVRMLAHENIVYSNINEIPDENIKQILISQNVKSILVVPLFVDGLYFGFIGFDDCVSYRSWPSEDIDILMSISSIISSATERALMEKSLDYQHNHDFLTGLLNRGAFEKELIRLDDEKYLPISLIIADTNGLKLINDSFGHTQGDNVLVAASNILIKYFGYHTTVARYGGDEFIIILPNTDEERTKNIVSEIDKMMSDVEIASIRVSLSFGYHTRVQIDEDFTSVFKIAEDMMYRNKLYESSSNKYNAIGLTMNSLFAKSSRESEHSKRVSKLCEFIATKMDFSSREISRMRIAGLMHDIGKIGVTEYILNKQDSLSQSEWEKMKKHPEIGYRILSTSSDFIDISSAILEHHERWDGKGYPRGIKEDAISIQARIINVADSFDAMTSSRPYKRTVSDEAAIEEIRSCSGTQFDPTIARIFIEHYKEFKFFT